jgi:hypothetical protein
VFELFDVYNCICYNLFCLLEVEPRAPRVATILKPLNSVTGLNSTFDT